MSPRPAGPARPPRPPRSARPPAPRPEGPRSHTYALLLEYDGTPYSGWQDQQNARTVVGVLKTAMADAQLPVLDLGGAGRTDAGVHALGQVAHLRLAHRYEPVALQRALNDRLPATVHVLDVHHADPRFHARHDAVSRVYVYQLSRRRTAFAKSFVWWVKSALDQGRLEEALEHLPGRHDFRLFAADDPEAKSTLVEMERAELAEDGDLLLLRFQASHFLWRMVRRLVGTLVRVGQGELAPADFASLVAARPVPGADPARWTAPPSGLFLEQVLYQGDPPPGPLRAVTPVWR